MVAAYAVQHGGRVIKYIGDEVMIAFDKPAHLDKAVSFLVGLPGVVEQLSRTGDEVRIKTAVDVGEVYLLDFKGHKEPDPIGTPVDRCARISKFAEPGTVVTTFQFAKETKRNGLAWTLAGSAELKGIGETQIYQLGSAATIVVADVAKENLAKMSQLEEKNRLLGEAIAQLKHQLAELGERPAATSPIPGTQEDLDKAIDRLKELINGAGVSKSDYARFLFLNRRGEGQEYNKYNRAFDECIEENLVENPGDDNYYVLNTSNRRNMKAIEEMENIEILLGELEPDEKDLFDYSLKEPSFWSEKIGYSVK